MDKLDYILSYTWPIAFAILGPILLIGGIYNISEEGFEWVWVFIILQGICAILQAIFFYKTFKERYGGYLEKRNNHL